MNERGAQKPARKVVTWLAELDVTLASAAIVGGTAVLSFNSSRELADSCGFHDGLSWVWPVCLDAVAYVSTRIWLSRNTDDDTRLYARRLAFVGIGLSLAANGLNLYLQQTHLNPIWLVILLVGAVPPAMLAAVVHMLVMRRGLRTARKTKAPKVVAPSRPKGEKPAETAEKSKTVEKPKVAESPEKLATVTDMTADAPTWLVAGMDLISAVQRYLTEHPEATPAQIHTHIGAHLGAKPDTTRKTVWRIRRASAAGEG